MKDRGIFCIETGDWGRGLARNTGVQPALDLLAAVVEGVSCFRRDAATRAEFEHYLTQWTRSSSQPILYLCFHGLPAVICLEDGDLDLEGIAEVLAGKCEGRVIHFSSCETFKLDEERLRRFLRTTGALALGGYRKTVDWMESAAFELLFMSALCRAKRWDASGMNDVARRMTERHGETASRLQFRFYVNDAEVQPTKRNEASYAVDDIVKASYEGRVYEPCVIEGVNRRAGRTTYAVYFDVDQSVVPEMLPSQILGRSDLKPAHDVYGPGYAAGDVVRAVYDGVEFDPCFVDAVRYPGGKRRYDVFFDADQTLVQGLADSEILGHSTRTMTPRIAPKIASPRYQVGMHVVAMYRGERFDPCQILDAAVVRGRPRYTVYFDADQTHVMEVPEENILGVTQTPFVNS